MTHIANKPSERRYHSQLRDEQAAETRARILDATVRVMARGIASVSVPAVAREAGVSVPTVYRHFGTKGELLEAVYPHVVRRAGLDAVQPPSTLDELRDGVRDLFARIESLDDLARAAVSSPAAEEARHASIPKRFALVRQMADTSAPGLADVHRDRLSRVLVILTTSSALRVWREHLGSSVDEAADDLEWIVRAAIDGASRTDR